MRDLRTLTDDAKLLITTAQAVIGSNTGGFGIIAVISLEKLKQQIN